MSNQARNAFVAFVAVCAASALSAQPGTTPDRPALLAAMKRATVFMVDRVSHEGGYVWTYLPDLSRRWGEMEARASMVWIQPPGTATMGHLFLDAYHATSDEYYYEAAKKVAAALIKAQHPSGGWNYMADFAGDKSLRDWYATIGRNGWRLEEFQKHSDSATFDDAGTAESSKFLLRLFIEKRDPTYRPALDKAIAFVLNSQYPVGAWPQRYPLQPDYSAYLTFNDDVAAENVDFLLMAQQALGDTRLQQPIARGMNAFVVMQQPAPQAGWALQYTPDLQPAGARTYEPKALVTHTTASNIQSLLRFYRLTGDAKFLARIPEALDWLERVKLSPEVSAIAGGGRTHPTFVEIDTNKPLYVHRSGSNVVNGRYYVDYDPTKTIGHYSAFRRIDLADLRKRYQEARASTPTPAPVTVPRYYTLADASSEPPPAIVASLNPEGYWPAPLGYNTHPYNSPGSATPAPGDFAQTHVGDASDTSPFPDNNLIGISIAAYIRNMGALIRALGGTGR